MPKAADRLNRDGQRLRSVAILGGGTAGWIAASVLARALPDVGLQITLIESADVGTVGVGEATIPPILDLLAFLGINLADFVHHTQATYKLGIRFHDWLRPGSSYWHPFGTFGQPINRRPFLQSWHRAVADGLEPRFTDYSLCAALGDAGKFLPPDPTAGEPRAGLRYALHFDAALVARYLRAYAERMGVQRLERTVLTATQRPDGFLDELVFRDGGRLHADLYIDCSGFRGALIEEVLHTGYTRWDHLLPCDRAIAAPSAHVNGRPPYTQATAGPAGWCWRIPLQHRVGNGYVYSSAHTTDDDARKHFLSNLPGPPLAEPRLLSFIAGRRKCFWNRNCVALGLASGFLEPLESTSIHLVMSGVYNLLEHFPDRSFSAANIDSYNAELTAEVERIRDFIVLHYCLTERDDTPLWSDCRRMSLPDTLSSRIEEYRQAGRIRTRPGELFTDLSWFYILEGMGVRPRAYDPLSDVVRPAQFAGMLAAHARAVGEAVYVAPLHDSYFGSAEIANPVRDGLARR